MAEAQELPAPPVPDLDRTLDRFLAGVRPVVPAPVFEQARQLVGEFKGPGGVGRKLQESLLQLAETEDNWATYFWLDDMYLTNHLPLPVNSNPFFLLPKQQFQSSGDQLRFAAKIVLFALDYKKKIDDKEFKPDVIPGRNGRKGHPLCMDTYNHFFSAYRRPGEDKDDLVMSQSQGPGQPLHVVVACKNQFFSVQVCSAGGEAASEDVLVERLRIVTQTAKERESGQPPIGILTTENRTTWAKLRNRMLKRCPSNCRSLRALEDCLLVLCLDEGAPEVPNCATIRKDSVTLELGASAAHLLHGSGSEASSANRWYDKFLQVIVTRCGMAGFLVEHSASEGITVLRFGEELLRATASQDAVVITSSVSSSLPQPTPLSWNLDEETIEAIQEASKKMNKLCRDVDLFVHRFPKYGKDFIKLHRISPDAFIQVALQLTYYKVHRRLVSTYESGSLRRFRFGRVDNIRASTEEALAWVTAMCDGAQVAEEEKVKLFQACIKKQTEILFYTINGEGPDNHLLALREIAKSSGLEEPVLFQDKSYREFLNFRLSTSQLPTDTGIIVGYGPVVLDGYGCSYNPCADHIDFCVSSLFSSKETSSDFFAHSLEGSLLHMREICLKLQQMREEEEARIAPKHGLRGD